MAIVVVRLIVLAAATGAGLAFGPSLGLSDRNIWLGGAGLLAGALAVLLEWQARRVPVDRLFWGAVGGILGVAFGLGLGSALGAIVPGAGALGRGLFALLLAYLGATVSLAKRDELEAMSEKLFPRRVGDRRMDKILDTSVIIDGRIVSVCESGFLEGPLVVPQFVLHELQQIADSPDALRRNRAKRGFDVMQRLQRSAKVEVRIEARDFPGVREVDQKLLELARATGGKLVTNDYALNGSPSVTGSPCSTSTSWPARCGRSFCPASHADPPRQGGQGSRAGRRRISTTAPWSSWITASGSSGRPSTPP